MYCVRIAYPAQPGSSFNWDHYFAVHLPLGLGLLRKHRGVTALKVEVDRNINDGKNGAAPYHCICSLYFADQQGADALVGLFDIEEARRLLSDDWPKYTATDPFIMVSEIIEAGPASGRPMAG